MKRICMAIALFFISFVIIQACKKKATYHPTPVEFKVPKGWPAPQYNFTNNPLTREGIELGRKLFYDGRLSKDGGFPCSSCHQQVAAFGTYNHNLSHGYGNSHTIRSAPPLQNLAWHNLFNWDGSSTTIEQQTLKHIAAPDEMGETVDNVLNKLRTDDAYRGMFTSAFGDPTIDADRLSKALTQFVLTMVTTNSKYDKVMRAEESFVLPEQLGYDIYKSKCASCHNEPLFTDVSFRNIGMPVDATIRDFGRMRVTLNPGDSLKFKVPSLRNVDKTFPYGHDGRFVDEDALFEHYRTGVVNGPTTDPLVKNKVPLTNFEFGQLKAFISTLTDTAFLNSKQLGPP
jgi:cytochrome c peroxidase